MILVTVGTQLPFDRLVRAVDQWAVEAGRDDVIAQVGNSSYKPRALQSHASIDFDRFRQLQEQADVIISHAGMGSIVTALELGKPIIVLARDHRRGEHRNGHQIASLERFRDMPGVFAADHESDVARLLGDMDRLKAVPVLGSKAEGPIIARLRNYVRSEAPRRNGWRRLFPFAPNGFIRKDTA